MWNLDKTLSVFKHSIEDRRIDISFYCLALIINKFYSHQLAWNIINRSIAELERFNVIQDVASAHYLYQQSGHENHIYYALSCCFVSGQNRSSLLIGYRRQESMKLIPSNSYLNDIEVPTKFEEYANEVYVPSVQSRNDI